METEKSYESFARVYDELMDNVPYGKWAARILQLFRKQGIEGGLALELGCGTGKMLMQLGKAGYDMIGVDSSLDMLQIAREKCPADYLLLLQDMRSFELYGTVAVTVSVCDSINYIKDPEDLREVFCLVNNYLDPGGLFLFDFNTEHKYRDVIGETVIAEDREDVSFIWYNDYDQESHINEISLRVFVREREDLFRKFEETHFQRGYTLVEIRELLREAGMEFVDAWDGYEDRPAGPDSERILVLAREKGKIGIGSDDDQTGEILNEMINKGKKE